MQRERVETIRVLLCIILVLFTIALNFVHVWDVLRIDPATRQTMAATFLSEAIIVAILILTMIASALFLFRQTFKTGVALQALAVMVVIGLQLRAGHTQQALLQVPFLCATLVMFYLGYPFERRKMA